MERVRMPCQPCRDPRWAVAAPAASVDVAETSTVRL